MLTEVRSHAYWEVRTVPESESFKAKLKGTAADS